MGVIKMAQNDQIANELEKLLSEDIKIKTSKSRLMNYMILSFVKMHDFANTKDLKDFDEAKRYLSELLDMMNIM